MNPDILVLAIRELSPNAEFSFLRDDLSTLDWQNKKAPRPTDEEILARCEIVIENLKNEAETKSAAKAALLDRLGITAEEAALLLG
jgi:hypothetical protein